MNMSNENIMFYNIECLESVKTFKSEVDDYYTYHNAKKNIFGKIIRPAGFYCDNEMIVKNIYKNMPLSQEEIDEMKCYKHIDIDSIVLMRKAFIKLTFVSGDVRYLYFNSDDNMNTTANEILNVYNDYQFLNINKFIK